MVSFCNTCIKVLLVLIRAFKSFEKGGLFVKDC